MTCLALDDEPLALRLLENYIARVPDLTAAGFFTSPKHAAERLAEGSVDLLFLDVQMPDISGLQFLGTLAAPPLVIFTTAYAQYAVDGFDLEAVDFLLKPIGYERFAKAVEKAKGQLAFQQTARLAAANTVPAAPASLFVRSEYSLVQIALDEILAVESLDDYVKIHLPGRIVTSRMTLKTVLESLPPERFAQVHRSFVVALGKIEWLRARRIGIGGLEIAIGDKFWAAVRERLPRF